MPYVPLTITIPEPCSVPWDGMTPVTDLTRHCAECDKVITDFSGMTDAQIGRTLRGNGGNLCGRFRSGQLGRRLLLNGPRRRRGLGPVATAASLLLAAPVFGQEAAPVPTELCTPQPRDLNSEPGEPRKITGMVVDAENGDPLIGVSISVNGGCTGTVTDLDGNFSLVVPDGTELVVLSYTGYETQRVPVAEFTHNPSGEERKRTAIPLQSDTDALTECTFIAGGLWIEEASPGKDFVEGKGGEVIYVADRPLGYAKGDWKAYWREWWQERKARRAERRELRRARKVERLANARADQPSKTRDYGRPAVVRTPLATVDAPPGLEGTADFGLRATPNPFAGELSVSFILDAAGPVTVELFDANGRSLHHWSLNLPAGQHTQRLDKLPANLPAGSYHLRLSDDKGKVETVTVVR